MGSSFMGYGTLFKYLSFYSLSYKKMRLYSQTNNRWSIFSVSFITFILTKSLGSFSNKSIEPSAEIKTHYNEKESLYLRPLCGMKMPVGLPFDLNAWKKKHYNVYN